ncbi:MAG: hypothetical protein JW699_04205 [Chitinispirillaceae bacterium]|nr:hypothetical protein [Chitinispirillaceae bacterium]
MSITTAAAHQGTHSLTTDSNMTALYHVELPANRVESGTAGVEFYLMAQTPGQANFGVLIGQNPGSSGAITPAFGIFFDPSDSIKCMVFNTWPEIRSFTALAPVQADKWYKCGVEVNFTDSTVSFYLDDVPMHTESVAGMMADQSLMGIDRVLVFRDQLQVLPATTAVEGTKPYYVDDIVLYKK